MQCPMGNMIVVNQGKDLGFVDVPGVGPGVKDSIGILSKGLPIISQFFLNPSDSLATQTGKSTEMAALVLIKLYSQSLQNFSVIWRISFNHIDVRVDLKC
jgi:hypothetical protein